MMKKMPASVKREEDKQDIAAKKEQRAGKHDEDQKAEHQEVLDVVDDHRFLGKKLIEIVEGLPERGTLPPCIRAVIFRSKPGAIRPATGASSDIAATQDKR